MGCAGDSHEVRSNGHTPADGRGFVELSSASGSSAEQPVPGSSGGLWLRGSGIQPGSRAGECDPHGAGMKVGFTENRHHGHGQRLRALPSRRHRCQRGAPALTGAGSSSGPHRDPSAPSPQAAPCPSKRGTARCHGPCGAPVPPALLSCPSPGCRPPIHPLPPLCPSPELRIIPWAPGAGQTPLNAAFGTPKADTERSDLPSAPAQPLPGAPVPGLGAGSARPGTARHRPAPPGSARHGSAGLARLGTARLGSTRHLSARLARRGAPGPAPRPVPPAGGDSAGRYRHRSARTDPSETPAISAGAAGFPPSVAAPTRFCSARLRPVRFSSARHGSSQPLAALLGSERYPGTSEIL